LQSLFALVLELLQVLFELVQAHELKQLVMSYDDALQWFLNLIQALLALQVLLNYDTILELLLQIQIYFYKTVKFLVLLSHFY